MLEYMGSLPLYVVNQLLNKFVVVNDLTILYIYPCHISVLTKVQKLKKIWKRKRKKERLVLLFGHNRLQGIISLEICELRNIGDLYFLWKTLISEKSLFAIWQFLFKNSINVLKSFTWVWISFQTLSIGICRKRSRIWVSWNQFWGDIPNSFGGSVICYSVFGT